MNHVQRARLHQVLTYLVDIFRDSEGGERGLTRWEVVEGSAADSEHIDGLLAVLVGSGLVVYEDVTETRRFYRLAIQSTRTRQRRRARVGLYRGQASKRDGKAFRKRGQGAR